MSNYHITLKSVYSCPASEIPKGIKLPPDWKLSWHQAETIAAIRDPNIDVVFNRAMTGDGKSLAAYLDILQGQSYAIGLYPTNELARDQEAQIKGYIEQFQLVDELRFVRLSSAELEIYAENEELKKSAAIATRMGQSEVLVTNPDIFHYLHRGAYLTPYDNPDKLWGRIDKNFELFIFDEFHVFAAPQIASVINTMLLIRSTNRRKKFLFLSATPNLELIDRLKKAGFKIKEIDPIQEKKYQFPDTPVEAKQLESQGWRQVSRTIDLNFVSLESTSSASEKWLKENSDRILAQFLQHPGTKGAIILNSIAAVKRLVPYFRELLESHGLTVGENTGLSGEGEKRRSLLSDLVLGTSTIDVGVDFKINFLIFESADAGNFIQRLGRLGRHDGYELNGKKIKFEKFTAYALVPNFLVERLFLGDSPSLESEGIYERPVFNAQIQGKYREINDFQGYYSRWGAVQSVMLCWELGHKNIKSAYPGSQQALKQNCEQVFQTSLGKVAGKIKEWKSQWQQLSGKNAGNPIVEEASSFRGSSSLQCGLYDPTETNELDRFKTYDLPGILSNLEIEPITKTSFERFVQHTVTKTKSPIPKGRFEYCLGFMKLNRYREERLKFRF
jgi:CRISPR-associated endonuclease/helicase Cas3